MRSLRIAAVLMGWQTLSDAFPGLIMWSGDLPSMIPPTVAVGLWIGAVIGLWTAQRWAYWLALILSGLSGLLLGAASVDFWIRSGPSDSVAWFQLFGWSAAARISAFALLLHRSSRT